MVTKQYFFQNYDFILAEKSMFADKSTLTLVINYAIAIDLLASFSYPWSYFFVFSCYYYIPPPLYFLLFWPLQLLFDYFFFLAIIFTWPLSLIIPNFQRDEHLLQNGTKFVCAAKPRESWSWRHGHDDSSPSNTTKANI